MLILTRRPGERVVIGDEILVTVMGVSGHTVRLGIAAPEGIPIYREEIWLAVMEENRAAAEANVDALPAKGAAQAADTPPAPAAQTDAPAPTAQTDAPARTAAQTPAEDEPDGPGDA